VDRIDEELAGVGAILVDDRTLRRIIKRHRGIPGLGLQVPHAQGYALPRAELAPLVEGDGLGAVVAGLPEHVVVVTGVRAALLAGDPAALSQVWRAIFHGRVHLAFDAQLRRGSLGAAAIRDRIHRIGQTEFDEVRYVLRQEDLLLPPADDIATYVEFVAHYLELRHFAPAPLEHTFPSLRGAPRVDATIALDLDAPALLAASRPPRAPAQPLIAATITAAAAVPAPEPPAPLQGFAQQLVRRAAIRARQKGNFVRAAILAWRAGEPETARGDLRALVARLSRALGDVPTDGWAEALAPVAQFAAGHRVLRFTPGARLLHDLQTACVVAERELNIVDPVTWALSLRRQPIVRPLPATREVRVAKHLRGAAGKIARCDLGSAEERDRLAEAVHAMVARANQNVRAVLRPRIEAALDEVALRPRHVPERVAQKKIVDELLDHALATGGLSLGNLRDAIAHNDLKLPDLRASDLVSGDELLRADRILASSLDGVYRRGELYLRFLQKMSSVLSGTALGRLLTLYVLLPVVGSFFLVEGAQHIVGPIAVRAGSAEPEIATRSTILAVAVVVFLLLHVGSFRRAAALVLRGVGQVLRLALVALPRRLWRLPLVPPLTRWVLLPGLPAALAAVTLTGPPGWIVAAVLFAAIAAVVNSSAVSEEISDWLVRSGRHLTRRIVPEIVKYALDLFAWSIELLERGIYRVDEMLRFRPSESPLMVVVKGVIGSVWFLVAYLLRVYVNLFIEPTVNPIKHFPVVTVAAKLILPFTPQMISAIGGPVGTVLGPALGASFGAFTVLVLPGLAGFLAWELNSNWKLYRRTRADLLRAVAVGSHGESMVGFLRPGFHSGTVPKLHARMRRAAWKGDERAEARHKEALHHVDEAIWKFADRQVVSILNEAPSFRAVDVAVHGVHIESNRVRIELVCPSVAPTTATISFEQQSGWLVAGIPSAGWIDALDREQRDIVELALVGFYKLSGVDIVREQVEHVLARDCAVPPYDIADEGLVVWPGPGFETQEIHDLPSSHLLADRAALFGREPVRWIAWATAWEHLGFGMQPKRLLVGPSLLPPRMG